MDKVDHGLGQLKTADFTQFYDKLSQSSKMIVKNVMLHFYS